MDKATVGFPERKKEEKKKKKKKKERGAVYQLWRGCLSVEGLFISRGAVYQ